MSSSPSLWAPKAGSVADAPKPDMVAGTWLRLSPTTSAPVNQPQLSPLASPLPSPAVRANAMGATPEDLSLNGEDSKYLSNNASRSSSISSGSAGVFRHPPLGQGRHSIPAVERREAAIARGISLASIAHH